MTEEERNNAIKVLRNFDLNNPKVNSLLFSADEITNAFELAIKALEKEPRWISVKDRLPGDTKIVLLSTETNEVFEGRFFDDDTDCQWYTFRDETFLQNHVVTAWMPLPEPYESQESEDT